MRADVQAIFRKTPHDKQVMMFSATLSAEIRPVVKKFMRDVSAAATAAAGGGASSGFCGRPARGGGRPGRPAAAAAAA
jgi:hypothetical protein